MVKTLAEDHSTLRGRLARSGRFAGGVLAALSVWLILLMAIPLIRDEPGQYLVIGPSSVRLHAILGSSARLVGEGPGFTQIAGVQAGTVAQLYSNGAWLILPADRGGCLRLTRLSQAEIDR